MVRQRKGGVTMMQTNMTDLMRQYQQEKDTIALFRRDGLTWPYLLPLSVQQTLFPSILHNEKNRL